jgi:DNA (cytosine-5)-methyltransferase 1
MTLETYAVQPKESTSSPAVSPASLTALQESVKALVMSAISGRKSGVFYKRLNPDGSWEKTSQACFLAITGTSSVESSLTWPRWGILSDGVVTALSMWERSTGGTGCSLWPTPQAVMVDNLSSSKPDENGRYQRQTGSDFGINLRDAVSLWPTPQSRDWKGQSQRRGQHQPGDNLNNAVMSWPTPRANKTNPSNQACLRADYHGNPEEAVAREQPKAQGSLNPEWVCWLMMFPPGWLDLTETDGSTPNPTSLESQQESKTG